MSLNQRKDFKERSLGNGGHTSGVALSIDTTIFERKELTLSMH